MENIFSRLFLLLSMVSCTFLNAAAQIEITAKIAQSLTDGLVKELHLSAEQETSVSVINNSSADALMQLLQKKKNESDFDKKDFIKQTVNIIKNRDEELKKVFTPDQIKLYQEHKIQRLAELQTKLMTMQLDLDDEQIPIVQQINFEAAQEMMEDAEKLQTAKRRMQKMRAGRELKSDSKDRDKALKKVLTEDQYKRYEENKEQMKEMMKERMKEQKN